MELRVLQLLVNEEYNRRKPRRDVYQRYLSLIEELGELSGCILTIEHVKAPREGSSLEDEYADVLMNLLSLGSHFGLDAAECVLNKLDKDSEK